MNRQFIVMSLKYMKRFAYEKIFTQKRNAK